MGRTYLKFCKQDHINFYTDDILNVRFTRLQYFRMMDCALEDEHIGDRNEGTRQNIVNMTISSDSPKKVLSGLSSLVDISPGNTLVINNGNVINRIDCFVFSVVRCFSTEDKLKAVENFSTGGRGTYDACVEISDMPGFIEAVKLGTCIYGDISELFGVYCNKVKYIDRTPNNFEINNTLENANPFEKSIKYASQSEYRVILVPKNQTIFDQTKFEYTAEDKRFSNYHPFDWITVRAKNTLRKPKRVVLDVPCGVDNYFPTLDDLIVKSNEYVNLLQSLSFDNSIIDKVCAGSFKELAKLYWMVRSQYATSAFDRAIRTNGPSRFGMMSMAVMDLQLRLNNCVSEQIGYQY